MLGEAFAIVHHILVEVKDVPYYLPDNDCLWQLGIVLVLFFQVLLPS